MNIDYRDTITSNLEDNTMTSSMTLDLSIISWSVLLPNRCFRNLFSPLWAFENTHGLRVMYLSRYVSLFYWSQYFFIIESLLLNWLPLSVKRESHFWSCKYFIPSTTLSSVSFSSSLAAQNFLEWSSSIVNIGKPLNLVRSACTNSSAYIVQTICIL